jgi:hypothetical protein
MRADIGWRSLKIRSCSAMTRPRSTGGRTGLTGGRAGTFMSLRTGLSWSLATVASSD